MTDNLKQTVRHVLGLVTYPDEELEHVTHSEFERQARELIGRLSVRVERLESVLKESVDRARRDGETIGRQSGRIAALSEQCGTLRTATPTGDSETPWVHNHGSEDVAGLACRERIVDGRLRGDCLAPTPEPKEG
jgi:hypothetical protein